MKSDPFSRAYLWLVSIIFRRVERPQRPESGSLDNNPDNNPAGCKDGQMARVQSIPESSSVVSHRRDAPLVTILREFQKTTRGLQPELPRLPKFDPPSSSRTPPTPSSPAVSRHPPQIRLFNLIFANRADPLASVSNPGRRAFSQGSA